VNIKATEVCGVAKNAFGKYIVLPKEMSTARLQRIGQEYHSVHYRTIGSIFSLQYEHKISACAPIMFPLCTVRK